jgi:hypothetical protein
MMTLALLIATGTRVGRYQAEPDVMQEKHFPAAVGSDPGRAVAEVTLLLPHQQLKAVESAAIRVEMTVGQWLRRLIRNGLGELADAVAPEVPALPTSCASPGSLPDRSY